MASDPMAVGSRVMVSPDSDHDLIAVTDERSALEPKWLTMVDNNENNNGYGD